MTLICCVMALSHQSWAGQTSVARLAVLPLDHGFAMLSSVSEDLGILRFYCVAVIK